MSCVEGFSPQGFLTVVVCMIILHKGLLTVAVWRLMLYKAPAHYLCGGLFYTMPLTLVVLRVILNKALTVFAWRSNRHKAISHDLRGGVFSARLYQVSRAENYYSRGSHISCVQNYYPQDSLTLVVRRVILHRALAQVLCGEVFSTSLSPISCVWRIILHKALSH